MLQWTVTYSIPRNVHNHINKFELHWRTLILLTVAYVVTLTYGGWIATGITAFDTALLAAQLVRMTRRYFQQ